MEQNGKVKTNDLKKGTKVVVYPGLEWEATIEDNMKGNIRLCNVHGFVTEMGSVYSHDILRAFVDGAWHEIEYTPAQEKLRKRVVAMGL